MKTKVLVMSLFLNVTVILVVAMPTQAMPGPAAPQEKELDHVTVDLDMPFPEDPEQVEDLLALV